MGKQSRMGPQYGQRPWNYSGGGAAFSGGSPRMEQIQQMQGQNMARQQAGQSPQSLSNALRSYTGGSTWNTAPTGNPSAGPSTTPYRPPATMPYQPTPTPTAPPPPDPARQQRIQQMFSHGDPRAITGLQNVLNSGAVSEQDFNAQPSNLGGATEQEVTRGRLINDIRMNQMTGTPGKLQTGRQEQVQQALGQNNPQAIAGLRSALTRQNAIQQQLGQGNPNAIQGLRNAFNSGVSPRQQRIQQMFSQGNPAAIQGLRNAFNSGALGE